MSSGLCPQRTFIYAFILCVCVCVVTGVTEQQAGVSTGRFELLLTDGAARVRNQPRISWRILKLPTVTRVPEHTTKKLLNSEVYSQHLFF